MDESKILSFVILVGKILLENGAETWRVEDTMERIISSFDVGEHEVFATITGIFASIKGTTRMKRIHYRTINMSKISMINDLSRKIVDKKITLEEAEIKLNEIENFKTYNLSTFILSHCGCCAFFAFLLGGTVYEAINVFISGFILSIILEFFIRIKLSSFLYSFLGSFIVSTIGIFLYSLGLGNDTNVIIVCSILPLLPGLAITGAIRDIFHGDFLSGSGRTFDAIMCAIAIATGVGSVLSIWLNFFK